MLRIHLQEIGMKRDRDFAEVNFIMEKCELNPIRARVYIASLNSHFTPKESDTNCGGQWKITRVGIKV